MPADRLVGILFALAYTVCWAATGVALLTLADRLDISVIIGARTTIGALTLVPIALLVGGDEFALLTPVRLMYLVGSVLLGAVLGGTLNVYSMKVLGMSRAFPITNAHPILTFWFSHLLLGEEIRWVMVPGAILVILGVYLIARSRQTLPADSGDGDLASPGTGQNEPTGAVQAAHLEASQLAKGLLAAIATAVLYGLVGVLLAKGLEGTSSIVANSVRLPAAAAAALCIAAVRGKLHQLRHLDARTAILLLLVGTIGYAGTSTLYVTAVKMVGPSITAVFSTTAPVFALPMSILILKERPTRQTLIGTVLAVAGILMVI